MSLDTFEQSLLSELRQHVVARASAQPTSRRRRTARVAAGGLAVVGAVVVVLGTGIVGPSAAYAVEPESDGDVVVTIYDLTDASGLEHALASEGIRADVTDVPDFSQAEGAARTDSGDAGAACDITLEKVDGGLRFTLGAAQIATGSVLHILTSGSSPTDVGSPVEVVWSGGPC